MTAWKLLASATLALCLCAATAAGAAPVDELLRQYQSQGAGPFSAAAGEKFWEQTNTHAGEPRRCALCHSSNLSATGKHAVTGKAIKPLAPSANPERLADTEKIEKWLERNCKWTLGRSCTPQEKGDVLVMIRSR